MDDQILTKLGSALVYGSLTDEALLAETEAQPVLPILPQANVIKIGGQSFGVVRDSRQRHGSGSARPA